MKEKWKEEKYNETAEFPLATIDLTARLIRHQVLCYPPSVSYLRRKRIGRPQVPFAR